MAESKQGRVSRLLNMLRGKKDGEAEAVELRMKEIPINLTQKKRSDSSKQIIGCDICMVESVFALSLYLCYVCGVYLCEKCRQMHDKTHEFVKRENVEIERRGKAKSFVFGMRGENKVERREGLDGESFEVIGRVYVKHELDESECLISGLSRLDSKRWVAVDSDNCCIKMFCSVSNTLLRYIKFESRPWDAAEIKVQQKRTDPDSTSCSITDISGTAREEPDKHCLLAVTFPHIKQIFVIDVNKTPAVKSQTIKMVRKCMSIDSSENHIFTLCLQNVESVNRYSIDILSTEGDQLKVVLIPNLSTEYVSDLAYFKGRVYLTDYRYDRVLCINVEDEKFISQVIIEGSSPRGISVDHNKGAVYVCGWDNSKVYKLSADLRKYGTLSLDTDYTLRQCFINNRLYISHGRSSSLRHIVFVILLLT